MGTRIRKAGFFAGAVLAGVGAVSVARAAPASSNTSPVTLDGWTISWPTGVGLAINQDATTSTQVDIEKTAEFTSANQGLQVKFAPAGGSSGTTANVFVIPDETILNHTGSSFSGFSFILLNTGSVNATFGGSSPGFKPPTGSGYNYTKVSVVSGKQELDYVGTQGDGVTSLWGDGNPGSGGDNLVIDAPAGSSFSLKELAVSGVTPPPGVPMPSSLWQSLAGLSGLGVLGLLAKMKRRGTA
jgi:hypothetical protein